MKTSAKHLAREAESSTVFETVARAGYVANGIVHALIGIIVLVVASGGDGEGDQAGAMKAVAGAPAGFIVLWLIAIGLGALGVWHAVESILARDLSGDAKGAARKWGRRLAEWGQALVFLALGAIAAAVAMGARPDAEETTEDASHGLLQVPGGPILLTAIGLGIAIGGVSFIVMGARRSFRKRLRIPEGRLGRGVTVLGIIGFVAKGVALAIVGVLLVIAGVATDAETAGGLDGAVDALLDLALGPALAWLVGLGLIAYGAFTVARARFARM
ncbi:DUF1206 domain-containing protein [Microbacterium sp. M3]|uniref:DUF1206 domain-containing protein n=1 Tax=Microbacterium arthrosphaerae TaxID=792652 RepID=A0ABU4H1H0_9MICO|nr:MULTISPECIES: DUF1206 domain-containing protein [Microbacterium]MDW4573177.1 DUF1206 domain-containing protein [Microbacterium arthrosphaerae]MDW7607032.1 DUF1206 domain-containing protein [Microbacterium sp. M3]